MLRRGSVPYEMTDFPRVPKLDAHVHLNSPDPTLPELAREHGFALLTINTDCSEFPHLDAQRAIAVGFADGACAHVHWATTFSMAGFGEPGWAERVVASLTDATAAGACAVKFWKNIGLSEKDAEGRLILLDDPGLTPVVRAVHALGVAAIGHQGEPHNCWLPLEQMTTDNDRRYFARRPHCHMHVQPELPRYDDVIAMRDRFLTKHPGLRFVGAHLGSMEHDIARLEAFLDRFPDAVVDTAARIDHLQHQSLHDHAEVRAFVLRHHERLLYGSDMTFHPSTDPERFRRAAAAIWTGHWRYLATAESQWVDALGAVVPGLALPREVVDRIYAGNAIDRFRIGR